MRITIAGMWFLFVVSIAAFSQSSQEPYWLLYDQAKALMEQMQYGKALRFFQESLIVNTTFPEAESAIGDIYREEGEADLAIKQYTKAYDLRNNFYIKTDKYRVLYKLARICEEQQAYVKMEASLILVIQDDKDYMQPANSRLNQQLTVNYYNKGLDYDLTLYHFGNYFAQDAHSQLGWFYYKTGRFEQSVIHLLYSILLKIGQAIEYSRSRDIDFEFRTLSDYLTSANTDADTAMYLQTVNIYKDLYYLAGSTYAQGSPMIASSIWKVLSSLSVSNRYSDLSKDQIRSPWIEPYLPTK
jgi:tetratricopeptide (TPR) repeat protein